MSDDPDSFWGRLMSVWWGQILIGVFMLLFAWFMYSYITRVEEVTGRGRVHWAVAIVYNIAGKWGTVLFFAIPGLIFIGIGIRVLISNIRARDED